MPSSYGESNPATVGKGGIRGRWEAPGRGAKPKWQASDLDYLTDCLEYETRTYNSMQLAKKLKQERLVDLSSDRLRRLLKKTRLVKLAGEKARLEVSCKQNIPFSYEASWQGLALNPSRSRSSVGMPPANLSKLWRCAVE
jgi:hypothetical protein